MFPQVILHIFVNQIELIVLFIMELLALISLNERVILVFVAVLEHILVKLLHSDSSEMSQHSFFKSKLDTFEQLVLSVLILCLVLVTPWPLEREVLDSVL